MPEGAVPAGGLAYGMTLPKYIQSINLDRIGEGYDVKKIILDHANIVHEAVKARRRVPMTFDEIRAFAESLNLSEPDLLAKTKSKTKDLSGYITASRDVLAKGGYDLNEAVKGIHKKPDR